MVGRWSGYTNAFLLRIKTNPVRIFLANKPPPPPTEGEGKGGVPSPPRGSAVEPRRRDEPREGRRQRPRPFTSAAAPREGKEKCRRATPMRSRHGGAGGNARGKAWGEAGGTDEPRDEGTLSVAAGEAGILFFVFSDFCDWSTFFRLL